MTSEQLLRDAENELQKARADNGHNNVQAIGYALDALGLMINAQLKMLAWMRGKPEELDK